MKEVEKSLKSLMIFLLCFGFAPVYNGIIDVDETNKFLAVLSIIIMVLPLITYLSILVHSKNAPKYCKYMGILEIIFEGCIGAYTLIKWDSFETIKGYILIGSSIIGIFIGLGIIFKSMKYQKLMNNK